MYSSVLVTARPLAGLVTKDIKSFALNHGEEYRQIGVITMSTTDWIAVPDNPIQRNTQERAKRANHLVVFEPVHAEVSMAMLPDGSRFKIDGHTRAHKWASGDVKNAPRQVEVKVYGFLHDGAEAVPFWQSYSNNEGRKSRTHMDAVQGLSDATLSETQKRSRDAHANLFRKGLRAYVAWRKEELFAVGKGQGIRGVAPESAREFCRSAYRRRQSRIV